MPHSPLSAASPSLPGWPPGRPASGLARSHGCPGTNAARRSSLRGGLPPAGSPPPPPAPGRALVPPRFCPLPPLALDSSRAGSARQQPQPPVSSEHAGESETHREPQVQRGQRPVPVGLLLEPGGLLLQVHGAPRGLGSVPC